MKIRFYVNSGKSAALAAHGPLAAEARAAGLEVAAPDGAADLLVALGGDGTMLRAVHEFPAMPVVGFNLGGLGYLSSVGRNEVPRAFAMLAAGRFAVHPRAMLEVSPRGGAPVAAALNEIAVMHGSGGHAAVLDVECDGRAVTRYLADGVVVATPTGSTAYSLAAGGPVLMPDAAVCVLTPLNPHALGTRPVVVRDTVRFTITARERGESRRDSVGVYADGEQAFALQPDEAAEIRRSDHAAQLVELEGYDPYETLSRKLGWRGSSVKGNSP